MGPSLAAIVAGVVLLAYAADQFVLGAARIALLRRVSPILVGVVIVGFGTSTPELLVSVLAALGDEPAIAVGNIVGSNIANLSLLLGVGALLTAIAVDSRTVRAEAPLTVAAMALFAIVVQGGISRLEGVGLAAAMALTLYAVSRRAGPGDPLGGETEELAGTDHRLGLETIRTVLGMVGTVAGAQLLLAGATDVAAELGLATGFVGATLVAVGTSLPELVTVVQSARRGESDLIVGNLLGSNLFNALAVGGIVGVVAPGPLDAPALTGPGAIGAVVVSAAVWVMMRTGHRVTRVEGILLIAAYGIAIAVLR